MWIFDREMGEGGVSGLIDWLKAHASFLKPLHRYEGEIKVKGESIELAGRNTKTDEDYSLDIKREDVLNMNIGYDDFFRRNYERSLGAGLPPLRINYGANGEERRVYIFVNYRRFPRSSDNGEWFEKLTDWLTSS